MSSANTVIEFPGAAIIWIPDGLYRVAFTRYTISTRFGRGSLEIWFKVTDYGAHFEQPLCRYYKVQREGKRSFRASRHSAYAREFAAVFGRSAPTGSPGISCFRDIYIDAQVRSVNSDHRQRKLPDVARYSVIGELVRTAPS